MGQYKGHGIREGRSQTHLLDGMNGWGIEVEATLVLVFLVKKGRAHNVAVPVSSQLFILTPFLRSLRSFTKGTSGSGVIGCNVRNSLYPRLWSP